MICNDCKIGGDINNRGLWMVDHDRQSEAEKAFTDARMMHEACVNAGCFCQHAVGQRLHA